MTIKRVVVTAVLAVGVVCAGMARAAEPEYPSRTVRLMVANLAGVTWEFIPGKGGAQAVLDLVTGQADIT